MSEVVAVDTAPESQSDEATSAEVAEQAATPAFDETTWKRRLAGKDQALTATQQERDRIKAELADLSRWKAERENADLTELQKLEKERDALRAEAAQAKAEAAAVRLKAAYPLAADILGDDLTKFDEARVAEINGRLTTEQASESEPDARIDTNNPRRAAPRPTPQDLGSALDALRAAPRPFVGDEWGDAVRR